MTIELLILVLLTWAPMAANRDVGPPAPAPARQRFPPSRLASP